MEPGKMMESPREPGIRGRRPPSRRSQASCRFFGGFTRPIFSIWKEVDDSMMGHGSDEEGASSLLRARGGLQVPPENQRLRTSDCTG